LSRLAGGLLSRGTRLSLLRQFDVERTARKLGLTHDTFHCHMELPSREALLDIEWLARTHAGEGFASLVRYLRRGAETYGGPVTAIAEALLNARPFLPQIPLRSADRCGAGVELPFRLMAPVSP
jgi:hypothetical protein